MMDRRRFLAFAALLPISAQAGTTAKSTKLISAARAQIGRTTIYDPAYVKLGYPGGDVPAERGVCTDVVIRAYREGLGIDLQKLVHEDMRKNFAAYPKTWGSKKPDRNIDHRRVPNLRAFFSRKGVQLAHEPPTLTSGFNAGDLVTMMLPGNLPHIAIVSDQMNVDATRLLLIHNIGAGTQEEDILFRFAVTGHYRFGV
jgi:uncharacterized protein